MIPVCASTSIFALAQAHAGLSGRKVILHKDEVHQIPYVADVLKRVMSWDEARASKVAVTAFTEGRAVVIACPLEEAEYYQEQLTRAGLRVSIE